MLYVLCVEVLACKIRASQNTKGFLLPGARGLQFKVCQYGDDTTAFVKSEKYLNALFDVLTDFERGSGAKLNQSKTEALWLGAWKDRTDEPLGLTWVRKTKLLGTIDVVCDNWEPRLSKVDKCLSTWKNQSLSMIGKVLVLKILGFSKLLFVSSTLSWPKWVYDRMNQIIWPFLWGPRIETIAQRSFFCPVSEEGLGLREFRSHGQASCLSILCRNIINVDLTCFYLLKYFCGAQLASMQHSWASLRDKASPSALSPSIFYVPLLQTLRELHFPSNFSFSAKEFYSLLFVKISSAPILTYLWNPFVSRPFSLVCHGLHPWDNFTQNDKNDIAWLDTIRTIKVRHSLRNWGYISSSHCASCSRIETIDHCFLNCRRAKSVRIHFLSFVCTFICAFCSKLCERFLL